jgi:hypothetical protein
MEFIAVFIPHLDIVFPMAEDADRVSIVRRKLFTAMTRAQHHLILTYQDVLPKPLYPVLDHMWCENYPS